MMRLQCGSQKWALVPHLRTKGLKSAALLQSSGHN